MNKVKLEEVLDNEIKMYEEVLEEAKKNLAEVKENIEFNEARGEINNYLAKTKKSFMFGSSNLESIKKTLQELNSEEISLNNQCSQVEGHLKALKSLDLDDLE